MIFKTITRHNFTGDIIKTISRGDIVYIIKYQLFTDNIVYAFGKKIREYRKNGRSFNGEIEFDSVEDAEDYLKNIEKPEVDSMYAEKFMASYYDYGVIIYPKGCSLLSEYGCFVADSYTCGYNRFQDSIKFYFYDKDKYGYCACFKDPNFFQRIEENIQYLIEKRHLNEKLGDCMKSLTISTVTSNTLSEIQKASDEIKDLHSELQTFYDSQNKMMEFIDKLNLKKK